MRDKITYSIAEKCGADVTEIERMLAALADTFKTCLAGNDSIAIPGFGTFTSEKRPEKIVNDEATGRTMLTPPSIEITFTPALRLIKSVKSANKS